MEEPMSTECAITPCVASREVDALLHPLVILSISDHWTRTRAQDDKKQAKTVFGALLGKHQGRQLEIINSFELRIYEENGVEAVNAEFLNKRHEQYKEVFPELDLIGWYSTGDSTPSTNDLLIHKTFLDYVESPVLLKLDVTASAPSQTKLPVAIWENAGSEACSTAGLKPLPWSLISEESERIGVDHVTRLSTKVGSGKESDIAKHLRSNNAAVSMLISRVKVIQSYLSEVQNGKLPFNDEIVREANKLCLQLPLLQPADLDAACNQQTDDVHSAVLLSKLTETVSSLNQLLTKVNTIGSDRMPMGAKMGLSKRHLFPGALSSNGSGMGESEW